MGDFYHVIKTIKGHRYVYRQRTFRQGGEVKTECHYVRPLGAGDAQRISAEREIRKGTPNIGQVAATVKMLSNPAQAAAAYVQPWVAGPAAVNTTFARRSDLDRHLAALGAVVVEHSQAEGAFYNVGLDAVVIPSGERFIEQKNYSSTEAFYHTLLHEIGHWTGSVNRLNRKSPGRSQILTPADVIAYAREELVVEATAVLVLAKLGMPLPDKGQSAKYFQGYLSAAGNRDEALEYTINEAHRAAGYILASPQLTAIKAAHGLI